MHAGATLNQPTIRALCDIGWNYHVVELANG
jgi:hypothetical protein